MLVNELNSWENQNVLWSVLRAPERAGDGALGRRVSPLIVHHEGTAGETSSEHTGRGQRAQSKSFGVMLNNEHSTGRGYAM